MRDIHEIRRKHGPGSLAAPACFAGLATVGPVVVAVSLVAGSRCDGGGFRDHLRHVCSRQTPGDVLGLEGAGEFPASGRVARWLAGRAARPKASAPQVLETRAKAL